MKKYLGLMTIPKEKIKYPSPKNPRIEGLSPKDPGIEGLAKSIKLRGLQYPPILNQVDDHYEAIDGDRRLIALFDVLGEKEVNAMVWKIDEEQEINYMKLAANWDREDFSAIEKGAYIWGILTYEMEKDGKIPVTKYWRQREIRNEYLSRVANSIVKPRSTIAKFITLWLQVPEYQRERIAKSRDELKENKISPNKAMKITLIGKKLKAVNKVWNSFVPVDKPVDVSVKELEIINRAVRIGQIKTVEQLEEFREEKAPQWTKYELLLKQEESEIAAKIASKLDVEVSKVFRGAIRMAEDDIPKLQKYIAML
jgi:hypothetical protein